MRIVGCGRVCLAAHPLCAHMMWPLGSCLDLGDAVCALLRCTPYEACAAVAQPQQESPACAAGTGGRAITAIACSLSNSPRPRRSDPRRPRAPGAALRQKQKEKKKKCARGGWGTLKPFVWQCAALSDELSDEQRGVLESNLQRWSELCDDYEARRPLLTCVERRDVLDASRVSLRPKTTSRSASRLMKQSHVSAGGDISGRLPDCLGVGAPFRVCQRCSEGHV